MKKTPTPPKWATALLTAYCRPQLLEDLQGDLNEFFQRNLQTKGAFLARLIYIIDVLKFFRPYMLRKPSNPFNQRVLFTSYFRTSARVIIRNKLFSSINIIGMAVSLSVGLLVIAFVTDLFSYDTTLLNRDRIYRVTSSFQMAGMPSMKLATTSWKTGTLIRQEVPGIESLVILRNGFGGDAAIGNSKIPVTGLYANEGFFDVFSFPLIKGVASAALKDPHTLVLTQTTAIKLFGHEDPIGKVVKFDTVNYTVTGLMADIPKLSHIHFEMLVSLASLDLNAPPNSDGGLMDWTNFYSNYVYVLLKPNSAPSAFKAALDKIASRENAPFPPDHRVFPEMQPLEKIHIGRQMGNEIGPVIDSVNVYVLCGLALVILLSACFNYTNLSIARSLKRSREVGIRKVIGARRIQVIGQFMAESILISLLSLGVAFLLFLALRGQFLGIHPQLQSAFSLELSPGLILTFIAFAILVGFVAGILPALFYSKINAVKVLKDAGSIKVFRHISLRKALVVIQYTFSLAFITATIIGYHQYKSFLRFDLGFTTENILNIKMQGNEDGVFVKRLSALPAVKGISRSLLVSSLGSIYGSKAKYDNPADSAEVDMNYIDENYLSLHRYAFLGGRNFTPKPKKAPETETIVNEQLLKRFNIGHGNPAEALGKTITIDKTKLIIVGVLKDFHYGTLDKKIEPTALRYSASPGGYVNVQVSAANLPATMTGIETLWKQLDKVHPLNAAFYDDQIEGAYAFFSIILKVIGFFAALAICISSLGLFGMVVYTMEKRVKEISIRRVLGAGNGTLIYLLSKSFLALLLLSAGIALPLTWLFFQKVLLAGFAYHQPVGFGELFVGLFVVAGIALIMIGIQTRKIIRANPARVLKNE
ncbi:MAG TPA: ABC transporter permease [Puia sp.]